MSGNDRENLCRRCGRCCYAKVIVPVEDGRRSEVVYTPYPCPYLDEQTRLCTIYDRRHEVNPTCLTLEDGIRMGVFPAGCPYVAGVEGYVPPREHWTHDDLRRYHADTGADEPGAGDYAMDTLASRFMASARRWADRPAAVDPQTTMTYRQIASAASAAAAAVAATTDRARVGIAVPTCAEFPVAFFGTLLAGRTVVPLNFLQKPAELAEVVADAEIDTVLTAAPLADALRPLAPNVLTPDDFGEAVATPRADNAFHPAMPDDVAALLYTSGTSARPKGVMLTHRNLLANVDSSVLTAAYSETDVSLGVLPLFHTFGITTTMLLPLLRGAKALFLPRFAPGPALALMAQHAVTCLFAVPSVYRLLAAAGAATPDAAACARASLRFCVSGGEALGGDVADAFERVFARPLIQGYGLTETSPVVSLNPPDDVRPGSVGLPLSWARLRVVDDDDRDLPADEPGELLVAGPCVMKGYHRRPDETRAAFTADGLLRTGDVARIDREGYLYIVGRARELIVSAGENIAPGAIEAVLNAHPAVAESAVVPMPDASRGQVPRAFVVLTPDNAATADELLDHCHAGLARHMLPRRIDFRNELPHTLTGKVLKRALH